MDLALQVQMMGAVVDVLVKAMPDEVFAAEAARRGMLKPHAGEVLETMDSGELWTELTRRQAAGDKLLVELMPSDAKRLRQTRGVELWQEVERRLAEGDSFIEHGMLWSALDLSKIPAWEILEELSFDAKAEWAETNLDSLSEEKLLRWAEANMDKLDGYKWARWAENNLDLIDSDVLSKWVSKNLDCIEDSKLAKWANENIDRLDEDVLVQWAEDNVSSLSDTILLEWAVDNYEEVLESLEADAVQSFLERQEDDDLWEAIANKSTYRKLDLSSMSLDEVAAKAKELIDRLARG